MSTPDIAHIDGLDVDDYSVSLTGIPGVWNAPDDTWPSLTIPQRAGLVLTQSTPETNARVIRLDTLIMGSSASATTAIVHTLKDAVLGSLRRISFDHEANKSWYGVCFALPNEFFAPDALTGWASGSLNFLCPDPYAIDDTPTTVSGIAAERVAIQVGSGPTFPTVTVTGAATTPTITLRDHSGTSIATMTAATLSAGDCWRVSTLEGVSEKCVSGTWSSNLADLTAGYKFPVILPRYANRALSSWPTIETSAGTIAISYARRWA